MGEQSHEVSVLKMEPIKPLVASDAIDRHLLLKESAAMKNTLETLSSQECNDNIPEPTPEQHLLIAILIRSITDLNYRDTSFGKSKYKREAIQWFRGVGSANRGIMFSYEQIIAFLGLSHDTVNKIANAVRLAEDSL